MIISMCHEDQNSGTTIKPCGCVVNIPRRWRMCCVEISGHNVMGMFS